MDKNNWVIVVVVTILLDELIASKTMWLSLHLSGNITHEDDLGFLLMNINNFKHPGSIGGKWSRMTYKRHPNIIRQWQKQFHTTCVQGAHSPFSHNISTKQNDAAVLKADRHEIEILMNT